MLNLSCGLGKTFFLNYLISWIFFYVIYGNSFFLVSGKNYKTNNNQPQYVYGFCLHHTKISFFYDYFQQQQQQNIIHGRIIIVPIKLPFFFVLYINIYKIYKYSCVITWIIREVLLLLLLVRQEFILILKSNFSCGY